jgi:chromosome segregation ATPase
VSLERVDQYIRELEAIKHYDEVKAENALLSARVKEVEASLSSERKRVEELLQANKGLQEQIGARHAEPESLRDELRIKEGKIREVEEGLRRLSSRVKELEELKALTEAKTLKEAEELFLKAKEGEIKERAEKLFNQWKSEWERGDKPKEVLKEAVMWLKHTIELLSKPEPRLFLKEVADARLPEKVEEVLNSEVKRRVDAEFLRRVEEESSRKALEELERLKSVEWPSWYRAVVEPRILQLESQMRNNAVRALEGLWILTCDKCGTKFQVRLTAQGMEELLKGGSMTIECPNPNCVDSFLLFSSRHKVSVTLKELIELKCVS